MSGAHASRFDVFGLDEDAHWGDHAAAGHAVIVGRARVYCDTCDRHFDNPDPYGDDDRDDDVLRAEVSEA